jgi:hydroxymethylglutaryl-CoA lyase
MDIRREPATGNKIHLVECPRDAMQGWKQFIPTQKKVNYLNALLKVGFDTLDCGSFVSPKAIPQMADTAEVLQKLQSDGSPTRLLVIIANARGATQAVSFEPISLLGFPFSVSETFQVRNTNSTILESLKRVSDIQEICTKNGKQLVIYISMGFGNPYGDPYNEDIVYDYVEKLSRLGIGIFSLADTVGLAKPEQVYSITKHVIREFPKLQVGVHLHSRPEGWKEKVDAALQAGCSRFDGALKGIGGCPMANDELVGNLDTRLLVRYFRQLQKLDGINDQELARSNDLADEIFA